MKVKEYRKLKGYTQNQMANILGIKQNTYSEKENGNIAFSAKEMLLLERLLGTTINELFKDLIIEVNEEINKYKQ